MKRQHVREPAVTFSKRVVPDLPRGSDPDDAVLLPGYRPVPDFVEIPAAQELKFYDTHRNLTTIAAHVLGGLGSDMYTSPSEGGLVSAPVLGDTGSNRFSRRILVKNWRWTGVLSMPVEGVKFSPPTPVLVWLAVVLDTQWNGNIPSSNVIFSDYCSELDQQFPPFRSMATNSRFQVLKSEVLKVGRESFTIDSTAVPPEFSWAGDIVPFDFFVPADFFIEFGASNDNNPTDRAIYLIANQSGGEQCYISWHFRLRFYDV